MTLFGHIAGGYLVGSVLASHLESNSQRSKWLRLLGACGGLLPDLDGLYYYISRGTFRQGPDFQHHTWITHTFPFYVIPGLLLYIWGKVSKRESLANASLVVTAGACVHLVQDMFGSGDGIRLFYPFSTKMFGVRLMGVHGEEWRSKYMRDPIFLLEVVITIAGLLVGLRRLLSKVR